ncbi:MAG: hypothetical protein HZA54_18420 [Planctomycetes bacterium]|nr:hypothetical protein [Planctomycetota bacterium]
MPEPTLSPLRRFARAATVAVGIALGCGLALLPPLYLRAQEPPSATPFPPATAAVPAHLRDAELLVRELRPELNAYVHKNGTIRWKGEAGADAYENRTDCSAFLNLLLAHAYGYSPSDLRAWTGRSRPLARTWCETIRAGRGFALVARVADVRPGDILAVRYPPGNDNTGHVMIAAAVAAPMAAKRPLVADTTQWELPIYDSTTAPHGATDTRRGTDGHKPTGAGRGVLRLYADRSGVIAGHAWSTYAASEFRSLEERPLVVGRLRTGWKPESGADAGRTAPPGPEPEEDESD